MTFHAPSRPREKPARGCRREVPSRSALAACALRYRIMGVVFTISKYDTEGAEAGR
jgi:hypothetical protein